jgi:hypothetical protein
VSKTDFLAKVLNVCRHHLFRVFSKFVNFFSETIPESLCKRFDKRASHRILQKDNGKSKGVQQKSKKYL